MFTGNRNGVGRLEILYNDGTIRITTDAEQNLTYIHIREENFESVMTGIDMI